jgi:hypothetical protein
MLYDICPGSGANVIEDESGALDVAEGFHRLFIAECAQRLTECGERITFNLARRPARLEREVDSVSWRAEGVIASRHGVLTVAEWTSASHP